MSEQTILVCVNMNLYDLKRGTYILFPRTQMMINLISYHAVENIHNSPINH